MFGFVTEAQIRQQVQQTLLARVREEDDLVKQHEESGAEYKRKYHAALLETPKYKKWTEQIIETRRNAGLLVTDQQLADIKHKRRLVLDDKAKYIGPTRLEETKSGKNYLRPTGQTGTIVQAVKGSDSLYTYTFMPDVPREAFDEHGPTVFVAQFQLKERTRAYFELERIPSEDEQ